MLNERGPLMFINTANTKIEKSSEQLVYDSRNPKVKKETTYPKSKAFTNVPRPIIFLPKIISTTNMIMLTMIRKIG